MGSKSRVVNLSFFLLKFITHSGYLDCNPWCIRVLSICLWVVFFGNIGIQIFDPFFVNANWVGDISTPDNSTPEICKSWKIFKYPNWLIRQLDNWLKFKIELGIFLFGYYAVLLCVDYKYAKIKYFVTILIGQLAILLVKIEGAGINDGGSGI